MDAISVGCIPVFFHPKQQALWPMFWDAPRSSVLFDWSKPSARNGTAVMLELGAISQEKIAVLQQGVADAAARMTYRGSHGDRAREGPDAIDALVSTLQAMHAPHGDDEAQLSEVQQVMASVEPLPWQIHPCIHAGNCGNSRFFDQYVNASEEATRRVPFFDALKRYHERAQQSTITIATPPGSGTRDRRFRARHRLAA